MSGFGVRLKEFAKSKGGVTTLAKALDMSQPQLSQYITESREPGISFLIKLIQLDCDIIYLLTGEHSMDPAIQKELDELRSIVGELQSKIDSFTGELEESKNQLKQKDEVIYSLASENTKLRVLVDQVDEAGKNIKKGPP